jgi:hypothetical protein
VSSRIEIGLLNMKGAEEGYGVGALMLPEAFVQKVKSQWRHYNCTHNFPRSLTGLRAISRWPRDGAAGGGRRRSEREAVWQVLVKHEFFSTRG